MLSRVYWQSGFTGDGVAEAGVTLGNASEGDSVMKNDKGVVLHLKSAAQGIALGLGVEGMKVTLE